MLKFILVLTPLNRKSSIYLDGMVIKIWDDDLAQRVDGDELRACQLCRIASARAELLDEFSSGLKHEDARLLAVHDNKVPRLIHGQAFWTWNSFEWEQNQIDLKQSWIITLQY